MNHTQLQQHQHQQRQTFDATSSILSDYDEYEILDEQSLYVLFNPKSTQTKSDILSLTNTSKDESKSDTEQESEVDDDDDEGDDEDDEDEIEQQGDDDEELNRTDVIDRDNLSNKINSWYTSNVVSSAHHLIDEKVASWELDEDEALQVQQQQKQQERSPITLLDESKSLLKEFYGDDLFKYLDQEDLVKFRKFHKMTDIKNYLLNKNDQTSTIMDQILYRVLLLKEHKQSDLFLHRKFNVGTTDYINYLTKGKIPQNTYVEPVTFSDTTGGGSSLIMCGGVGFGGSTSWNDI